MGQSFIACDREQSFLMPPDVRDWLPEGISRGSCWTPLRLWIWPSSMRPYREDGRCRPAYEPVGAGDRAGV
jgi:hypothetical protein